MTRWLGAALVLGWLAAAALAPHLAPHDPAEAFRSHLSAPPMRPRVIGVDGRWHRPFVYPLRLVSRLEQRYEEDHARPVPLQWFTRGRLVGAADESAGPWLPLGADSFGRDISSRLLHGARASLGVALLATIGALLAGTLVGAIAGLAGRLLDETLMRLVEFILVLPSIYLLLALRAVLPLVLSPWRVFLIMTGILAFAGWPLVARGVRAIVRAESQREYALAAVSLGAGRTRLLWRHLIPAARPFLAAQAMVLVPAFVLAEATLSFVGFGFPAETASWGTMLQEAANVAVLSQFPWCLSPAIAIVTVAFGVNLLLEAPLRGTGAWLAPPAASRIAAPFSARLARGRLGGAFDKRQPPR